MGGASKGKASFHKKTNSAVSFSNPNPNTVVIEDDESNEITRDEIANIEEDDLVNESSSIAYYESAQIVDSERPRVNLI